MKTSRLRWLIPLLAGWVVLWQAGLGFQGLGFDLPSATAATASCCAARHALERSACHAACCATPVGRPDQQPPEAPLPDTSSPLPEWVPTSLAGFLLPQNPATVSLSDPSSRPEPAAPAEPLFRRLCALLI